MVLWHKIYHKKNSKCFLHCTPTHMTDSTHISFKSQVFSSLLKQEDRGGAWCAGVDNAALAAEAALGRRHGVAQHRATAWCGGWCVSCPSACFDSHLSACHGCLGPQAQGLRRRERLLFCTVILRLRIVPLKDTAQKTLHETRHLTHHGTVHRDRQQVVQPCCSVTHPCTKNFGPPQPQNGPRSPKNLDNEPLGSFF